MTKKEIVGVVVDAHCPESGASKITLEIHENHERVAIFFPGDGCAPYKGDTVEIQYQHFTFLFFEPRNVVSTWSRMQSQIRAVHNTVPSKRPEVLLGTLFH